MSANDHLSPDQFPRRRFKVADAPGGYPAWVADVPVDHLTKVAEPALGPTGHLADNAGTARLERSMAERGYDPKQHGGFDRWGNDTAQPPELHLRPDGNQRLVNGNHRVWAAHRRGLRTLPTLISDLR